MQRLKTRSQFQAVMDGTIVSRTPHFALHRLALQPSAAPASAAAAAACADAAEPKPLFSAVDVWLGALVPKRWARRAVTRNTIKRQIYTVGATHEARLGQAAHVVRLRSAFARDQFVSATSDRLRHAVRAELEQLFGRVASAPKAAA